MFKGNEIRTLSGWGMLVYLPEQVQMKTTLSELRAMVQKQIISALKESYGMDPQTYGSGAARTTWTSRDWQTGPIDVTAEVSGRGLHITVDLVSIRQNGQPINFDHWLAAENKSLTVQGEDPMSEKDVYEILKEEALESAAGDYESRGDDAYDARMDEAGSPDLKKKIRFELDEEPVLEPSIVEATISSLEPGGVVINSIMGRNGQKPLSFEEWLAKTGQQLQAEGDIPWTREEAMGFFVKAALHAYQKGMADKASDIARDRAENSREDAHWAHTNRNNTDL